MSQKKSKALNKRNLKPLMAQDRRNQAALTRRRGPQLDPRPGEGREPLPRTRHQTSGCWRSTDPPWEKSRGLNPADPLETQQLRASCGHAVLTSMWVCQHLLLQHQTAALCSLMAASPANGGKRQFRIHTSLFSWNFLRRLAFMLALLIFTSTEAGQG